MRPVTRPVTRSVMAKLGSLIVGSTGSQPLGLTGTLNTGLVDIPYSSGLTATGDYTAPLTWDISVGTLPDGLSIASDTGLITGTPTTGGLSNFTVHVASADLQEASDPQFINVVD